MSPPGKTSGSTTNESVVNASRSPRRLRSAEIEARLILQRREQRIVEGAHEHVVDQILHRLAAAAMGERHRRDVDAAERSERGRARRRSCGRLALLEPAILIVGGAGAFGRNHQRAERRFRRAGGAERLALDGLDDASSALRRIGRPWGRRSSYSEPRICARRRSERRRRAA